MKIIFLTVLLLSACSTLPLPLASSDLLISERNVSLTLAAKRTRYPYFSVTVGNFAVDRDATTSVDANTLTESEKRTLLRVLDFIRFTVNTPEFFNNVKSAPALHAARVATGDNGQVNIGDPYDKDQLIRTIKSLKLDLVFFKAAMPTGTFSEIDPSGTSVLYVVPTRDPAYSRIGNIAISNAEKWDEGLLLDLNMVASLLFKDIMFLAGFRNVGINDPNNTADGLETIFKTTVDSVQWQNKYKTQLTIYRPYYELENADIVVGDTVPL